MVTTATRGVTADADPDMRIRFRWSENLREAMASRDVDKYELVRRLAKHGIRVSRQAVESWIAGDTAPRPHIQAAIGTELNMPARLIFVLENAPEVIAS
jgi:hypothetical protein